MTTAPNRPDFQPQNPAKSGCDLGWVSCTCFACAMGLDVVFFGDRKPSGCRIRKETGDTVGGTTLGQMETVCRREFDVELDLYVGSQAATPRQMAGFLRRGRGFIAQIGSGALIRTDFRSTIGRINHAVWVNEGRGWRLNAQGWWEPREVLVYDPAADGRWDWTDQGPSWWPWELLIRALAVLHPWGESDTRILGLGAGYVGVVPPPRVDFAFGAQRTDPYPDRVRVNTPNGRDANVRSRPTSLAKRYVRESLPDGRLFVAYQRTRGIRPPGAKSNWWFGDETGKRWIHASNLAGKGGDQ